MRTFLLIFLALTLTGCKMDKNTEGPIYEKYDIVEVYNPDQDTSVTIEDDDEPVDVDTFELDRTPANVEGSNTNR